METGSHCCMIKCLHVPLAVARLGTHGRGMLGHQSVTPCRWPQPPRTSLTCHSSRVRPPRSGAPPPQWPPPPAGSSCGGSTPAAGRGGPACCAAGPPARAEPGAAVSGSTTAEAWQQRCSPAALHCGAVLRGAPAAAHAGGLAPLLRLMSATVCSVNSWRRVPPSSAAHQGEAAVSSGVRHPERCNATCAHSKPP